MLHWAQETSYAKLIKVEGKMFSGWGCAECAWLFQPVGPPIGTSLDEMREHFKAELLKEFLSHACNPIRAKAANASSRKL
jgi:hypothetical protein